MRNILFHVKKILHSYPSAYNFLSTIYHEFKFNYSKLVLKITFSKVKLIRYNYDELIAQRKLGFKSQFGQDFFIYNEFFKSKLSGVFLDIGCNQPIFLNNTYYLEKFQGWSGLACDPISIYREAWQNERGCLFLEIALGKENSIKSFTEIKNRDGWSNMLSGFSSNVRAEDMALGYSKYNVVVRPASEVIEESSLKDIDFLSIDVEGAEMEVLSGFDFNKHKPKVILLENKNGLMGCIKIRDYLIKSGYVFYARIWTSDDVFVAC